MADHITCIVSFFFAGCFVLSPPPEAQGHYYDAQFQYQQPQQYHGGWHRYRPPAPPLLKPVDLMTDVVNSLGTRVLQQYVESGNVAFSPAGLGFILAALYEGSAGRSRQQIVDCLGYPRNREIVRIGLGDIHRRLRTYLNPDGFLGGLNLNRENTNLRPEYETVLMVYGFDLTIDLSNFGPNGTNNFGLKGSMSTTTPGTPTTTIPTTTTIGTTPPPNAGVSISIDGVTTAPVTTTTTIDTTVDIITNPPTTLSPTTTPVTTTTAAPTTTQPPATDTQPTTLPSTTVTTPAATTLPPPTTTVANTNAALLASTMTSQAMTTMTPGIMETTTPIDDIPPVVVPDILGFRKKRSNDGYYTNYQDEALWMQDLNIYADQPALPADVRDAAELQFLVNGCEPASVPAASYTTVLPFAYFPALKAAGLEFPLDNPRYSVMLFLPTERVDTGRLARELAGQNLRLLRKHLQPTWIRATIPSFMLRGFVTLTPYLQRLGIRDVFEPRLADLSPMTPDLGVYARDVQQSVAVNIRNFMRTNDSSNSTTDSTTEKSRGEYRYLRPANGLLDRLGLVTFTAERPFLYFIIDNETSVTLIAGRIDDPLNSRIL